MHCQYNQMASNKIVNGICEMLYAETNRAP